MRRIPYRLGTFLLERENFPKSNVANSHITIGGAQPPTGLPIPTTATTTTTTAITMSATGTASKTKSIQTHRAEGQWWVNKTFISKQRPSVVGENV